MPPKSYKKVSVAQQVSRPPVEVEPLKDPLQNSEELFTNPKSIAENKKAMDKMRLLTSIMAGVVSGLLNLNQLEGPLAYFLIQLLITGLIYLKVGRAEDYFKSKGSLLEGLGSGILIFICVWMIVVNVVYVL